MQGWSLNSIVALQSGLPWGINDATTDFSGTGEISAQNNVPEAGATFTVRMPAASKPKDPQVAATAGAKA